MDICIEFVIASADGKLTPAAELTLESADGIITPPSIGDIVPTANGTFRVVQRAYIPERSQTTIGKKSLTWSCILVPVKEVESNAD